MTISTYQRSTDEGARACATFIAVDTTRRNLDWGLVRTIHVSLPLRDDHPHWGPRRLLRLRARTYPKKIWANREMAWRRRTIRLSSFAWLNLTTSSWARVRRAACSPTGYPKAVATGRWCSRPAAPTAGSGS